MALAAVLATVLSNPGDPHPGLIRAAESQGPAAAQPNPSDQLLGLGDIAEYKHFTAHRASSADPTGGNTDYRYIRPGETLALAEIQGAGEIVHIWCTMAAEKMEFFPRWVVLRMYWDGSETPCVETPIGDFFGSGHGRQDDILSVPIQCFHRGWGRNCYFPMPFEKGARITLTNEHAAADVRVYWNIDYRLYPEGRLPHPMPRFHASYRQEFPTTQGKDYTILEAAGRGHFVGCVLSVEKAAVPGWFGEGDEIMTIDGEAKPSIWGTGTEDYFGTAWAPHVFSGPWSGFTCMTGYQAEGQRMTGYRFHLPDTVPFQKTIVVAIEHNYDRANLMTDHYSSVAYWYQSEPHKPFPPLPPGAERIPRKR
jgi:hypothetical protein